MFDSYVDERTIHNYPSTIVEKKAPTDDSIRLAEEFREKARNEILKTFTFDGDNIFKGSVIVANDIANASFIVGAHFFLNGREYLETDRLPYYELVNMGREAALRTLSKKIAEVVHRELIKGINAKQYEQISHLL